MLGIHKLVIRILFGIGRAVRRRISVHNLTLFLIIQTAVDFLVELDCSFCLVKSVELNVIIGSADERVLIP